MAVLYTPHFVQFSDNSGAPLSGGKLHTYAAGTSTRKATYTTSSGSIENTNPVVLDAYGRAILFLQGSYKFALTDSADAPVGPNGGITDNVTAFTVASETNEGFFQAFSGDGETLSFTLSENLGSDERALFVHAELDCVKNGTFASDTIWTKGTGWTIGSGVATATGSISTALEQTAQVTLVQGKEYTCKYTITRDAGSITLSLGGTAGTARSSAGTYSETIIAGSTQIISFGTSGFTGTLDNVSIRETGGFKILNPNFYTVDGTTLTFTVSPAIGTNNIEVRAPYTLIGAAGAAQVAADDAIAAASAAEDAQTAAEAALASIAGLNATSTTSLAIGTGSKSFTTQAGKGFIAGMWVLATSDADPTNYMHGYVSSYSGTTLALVVTNVGGSGTLADWTLRMSGTRGATGATGNIDDFSAAVASEAEAQAGTANDKIMTPLRTADAIAALAQSGLVPIKTVTAANVSSIDFVHGSGGVVLDGTYKAYAIILSGVLPASDGVNLLFRTSSNAGSSFDTGATDYIFSIDGSNSGANSPASNENTGATAIILAFSVSNVANERGITGVLYVGNPSTAAKFTVHGHLCYLRMDSSLTNCLPSGARVATTDVDGIRFIMSGGNITSGTITLCGVTDA